MLSPETFRRGIGRLSLCSQRMPLLFEERWAGFAEGAAGGFSRACSCSHCSTGIVPGSTGATCTGRVLPGVLLAFAHLRLAAPGVDFAKVQAHQGVGVVHQLLAPGADGGGLQRQAQLFIEFARQGLGDGFARFELAARKFPVARSMCKRKNIFIGNYVCFAPVKW